MSAEHLSYWDYDRDAPRTCASCGWSGRGADNEEGHAELLDVCCPTCGQMLLIVSYPTLEETRAAAAAGNTRACQELSHAERSEERWKRAEGLKLKKPGQLPTLDGDALLIDWDFEERDDERWTVLRHGRQEIWRELAYWEGYERFVEVFEILRTRYSRRLAGVHPTPASEMYLYGDKLSAPQAIDELNASLKRV